MKTLTQVTIQFIYYLFFVKSIFDLILTFEISHSRTRQQNIRSTEETKRHSGFPNEEALIKQSDFT